MTDLDNPLETDFEHPLEIQLEVQLDNQLDNQLEQLASHLVWKMGRDEETDEVVVRVGFASSTPSFAAKGRLRAVSDDELHEALASQHVRVQWME